MCIRIFHPLPKCCMKLYVAHLYVFSQCVIVCIIGYSVSCRTGDLKMGKKEVVFPGHRKGVEGVVGHTGHVQALAVSYDGKFLVRHSNRYSILKQGK